MPTDSVLKRYAYATLTSILLAGLATAAGAQNLPSFMEPIEGRVTSTPAETANKNVLALNTAMFDLYGDAAHVFKRNILAKHPVILGLFSGAGGRLSRRWHSVGVRHYPDFSCGMRVTRKVLP